MRGVHPYRLAVVHHDNAETVARYLPSNYEVLHPAWSEGGILIGGMDVAGWTLDDYVIPRLASGLIRCEERGHPHE